MRRQVVRPGNKKSKGDHAENARSGAQTGHRHQAVGVQKIKHKLSQVNLKGTCTALEHHSLVHQMLIGSLLGGRPFAGPGDTAQNKTKSFWSLCSNGLDSAGRAQGGPGPHVRNKACSSGDGEGGKGKSQVGSAWAMCQTPSRRNEHEQDPGPVLKGLTRKRQTRLN